MAAKKKKRNINRTEHPPKTNQTVNRNKDNKKAKSISNLMPSYRTIQSTIQEQDLESYSSTKSSENPMNIDTQKIWKL